MSTAVEVCTDPTFDVPDNTLSKILGVVYEENGYVAYPTGADGDPPSNTVFVRETDLTPQEAHRAVNHGRRAGLVETVENVDEVGIRFTTEGFTIAHEQQWRERQYDLVKSQNEASGTLATFTVILGAAALVQASVSVLTATWPANLVLTVFYALILWTLWRFRDRWHMMG